MTDKTNSLNQDKLYKLLFIKKEQFAYLKRNKEKRIAEASHTLKNEDCLELIINQL